jgi:hypothetical protein
MFFFFFIIKLNDIYIYKIKLEILLMFFFFFFMIKLSAIYIFQVEVII